MDEWGRTQSFYLGALGGFTFFLFATCIVAALHDFDFDVVRALKEYEGVFGSAVAVLAASAAIVAVSQQISATFAIEKQRISNKSTAARSILPSALSSYYRYNDSMYYFLTNLLPENVDKHDIDDLLARHRGYNRPVFPSEVLPVFERCIEYASRDDKSLIADILAISQIQEARIESIYNKMDKHPGSADEIVFRNNVETLIKGTLEIRARINRLFDYARRRVATIPIAVDKASISNAAVSLCIEDLPQTHITEWVRDFGPNSSILRK